MYTFDCSLGFIPVRRSLDSGSSLAHSLAIESGAHPRLLAHLQEDESRGDIWTWRVQV